MKRNPISKYLVAAAALSLTSLAIAGPDGKKPGGGGGADAGGQRPNPGEMFAKADANGDGVLTQDEVPAEKWEKLSRADADENGSVSQEELQAAMAARAAAGGGGGPEGGPGRMLKALDTDGDGAVSQAEAGERWERMSRLDKNEDGSITADELPTRRPGGDQGGGGNQGGGGAKPKRPAAE